jgi:para-aminobenzoate synthetase component I
MSNLPLVEELSPVPDSVAAFRNFAHLPHCLFLDSAQRLPNLGRYSFLSALPFITLEHATSERYENQKWHKLLEQYRSDTLDTLPPFQGGWAGLFSYDWNQTLENIATTQYTDFHFPAVSLGCYDTVIAWDHLQNRAWLIAHGWPEVSPHKREQRARQRIHEFRNYLTIKHGNGNAYLTIPIPLSQLAPQYAMQHIAPGLYSNFSAEGYAAAVEKCREYIYAGDIFQVNFAQRLLCAASESSMDLYLRLRERNPAPFAAYFNAGSFQVLSASPERFVKVNHNQVETRPIKGTRRRTFAPEADLYRAAELSENEKDRAENVMIVDLLRNDISQTCLPESVQVTQLCGLETYEYVQHLVSVVQGTLAPEFTPLDLLRTSFPGGSITGAPKVRAMEIIAELEPTPRGPYCGCLGYLSSHGTLDMNILIRTITASQGWWQFPVGGGIVSLSNIAQEYEETWHKAAGLLRAIAK